MKYTLSHEWATLDKDIATIGISAYAQKELGEVVFVELPKLGAHIKAHEEIAVVESTKAAVDIYSPLSGEVVEINTALQTHPHLINSSPEKEGWLCRIKIANSQEYNQL